MQATSRTPLASPALGWPDEPVIVMTRAFAAPHARVFAAHVDPQLMMQWWGPHGFVVTRCELDVRPGGSWRIEHRAPDGTPHRFHGTYLEVAAPELLVMTFGVVGMFEGQRVVNSICFDERDGATTLTGVSRFDSLADRDAMLATGMEEGARQTHNRLAALLKTL
ncbi:MAG: putative glutathione S-transferase-related transrane protein [Rhodospirillales bacterium]|jgi:uncharacterized protein YndB with AHSA1/START domain|nr:putative glutathione S-transferase-related transrane protein [Rhodospirillales bacterium]